MTTTPQLLLAFLTLLIPAALQHEAGESFRRWLQGPVSVLFTHEEAELAAQMITPEQQSAFREWFWARRDPDAKTPRNEFRDDFRGRVALVDQQHGDRDRGIPGWATVPGMLQLLLGAPTSVRRAHRAIIAGGAFRDLTIWDYAAISGRGPFSVFLVELSEGLLVANDPKTGQLPADLAHALSAAVLETIADPGMPLGGPVVDGFDAEPLPMTGTVRRNGDVIEGDLSIALTDIYGRAEGDVLTIELAVRFEDPSLAGVAPSAPEPLPHLRFRLSAEQLAQWSERRVRLVFTVPAPSDQVAGVGAVRVVELPTGRSIVARIAGGHLDPGPRLEPEHLLSVEQTAGAGIIAAFVEGTRMSTSAGAAWPSLLVSRR